MYTSLGANLPPKTLSEMAPWVLNLSVVSLKHLGGKIAPTGIFCAGKGAPKL